MSMTDLKTSPAAAMGGDMRKLIVSSLVSLDGIHGDPQSWAGELFDEQAAAESLAVLLDSDAMLMGKNTYEYFAPTFSSSSGPYLERINQMRKYVFSSTLTAADWNNTTIIPGDPAAAVRELKQQGDRHLVIYGYGQLAQTLLKHRLVDTLSFVINPVIVGSGITLFRPGERTNLRLVSVTERRNGVVTLTYANA
jgi:dihydrofolate reductase